MRAVFSDLNKLLLCVYLTFSWGLGTLIFVYIFANSAHRWLSKCDRSRHSCIVRSDAQQFNDKLDPVLVRTAWDVRFILTMMIHYLSSKTVFNSQGYVL